MDNLSWCRMGKWSNVKFTETQVATATAI